MRKALAVAAVAALALAGCSSSDEDPTGEATPAESSATSPTAESTPSQTPSATEESDDAVEIQIEIEGDQVEPNGKLLEVSTGETIRLQIESDRPAELHVHSRPEQEIEVEPGTSTEELTIETPGVVDVEEHESGVVVLQLEVH